MLALPSSPVNRFFGMAFPRYSGSAPATRGGKIKAGRVSRAPQTAVRTCYGEVRSVAAMTNHAPENRIGMGRRKVFSPEVAGETALRAELPVERSDLDHSRFACTQ